MVAGMFFTYANEVYKDYKIDTEIQGLKDDIANLEKENILLEDDLEYYDTDAYKEIVAKSELNKRLPGEEVIMLRQNLPDESYRHEKSQEIRPYTNIPIYLKWWDVFMGEREK